MKALIDNINIHKHKDSTHLVNNQIAYIPRVEEDQIEYMCFSYLENGERRLIDQGYQCCFRLRYLRFQSMPPRKAIKYKHGVWSMYHLVNNDVIHPFMLFINGRFIPWSNIRLAIGQDNYFLIVHVYNNEFLVPTIRFVRYAQIVSLPDHIENVREYYPEYDDPSSVIFSFNEECEYDPEASAHIVRSVSEEHHITYGFWTTTGGVNAFPVMDESNVKLTDKNIILFADGLLATGNTKHIRRAFDNDCTDTQKAQIGDSGDVEISETHEHAHVDIEDTDFSIPTNPSIKFDAELLTIGDGSMNKNDGSGESYTRFNFGVFINTKYTATVDNIYRTALSGLQPYVQARNAGTSNPEFLQELQVPFELKMDRAKKYDENVADAIKTMMSYNTSLFNKVFLDSSNLLIEERTGQWVIDHTNDEGLLVLYRTCSETTSEYILMMVNGQIYQYSSMIKYKANKCNIPIQGINPEDKVEFLRFNNISDVESDLIVNEDDGFLPYDESVINESTVMFAFESGDNHFTYPDDGLQHFPVEFSLEKNDEGNTKITFSNPFYYGKKLKVVGKNRFVHATYYLNPITANGLETFKFDLGKKFMYCHEYSKYMVYLNNVRLANDQFRLVLPTRTTTPFSKFEIYLTMPVSEGDMLDVYYVPSMMRDIIYIPSIPTSGDIVIDKSLINYGLSSDLYMIFVNGKKVPSSQIVDIDSTHVRIISDVQSTKHVCIVKYISDIDDLTATFHENEALWDTIMSRLSNEEIHALLGIEGVELTDSDSTVLDSIDVKHIMYELIRDQYLSNPRVDVTGPFVYDYVDVDTSIIEEYDNAGNAILPVADANRTDNLSGVVREWP